MTDAIQIRDVTLPEAQRPDSWAGATARGLEARKEREAIVKQVLVENADFGVIPGSDKPVLLKAGAEKIADALELYADYEELNAIQDFDKPLFFYRYRCRLRQRGSDIIISTGIGSCNSESAKYKYRQAERTCPACGKATIIKGREEYGGGWLCFARKGGCGGKYGDGDERITGQEVGQIQNPDIAELINTVDKMAQKRALVAAALNLGFSQHFTQDLEDAPTPQYARADAPKTTDEALRAELLKQAEKLAKLAGYSEAKIKTALTRLGKKTVDEMQQAITELQAKIGNQPPTNVEQGAKESTIKAIYASFSKLEWDDEAIERYLGGKALDKDFTLDQLIAMHDELAAGGPAF